MYLSPAKTQVLGRVMQTLAEPHAEAEVRERVGALLLELLDADYYASYVWDDGSRTFGRRVSLNMSDRNLATYETYFQHRDPITPVMQQRRDATLVLQVMPQHELVRTEFFNDFLYRDGLYWGVNLYAWDGEHNIGDMRIWRNRRRESFDQDTLDLLELVRPAFIAALRRARGAAPQQSRVQAAPALSLLSDREREIVQLASLGLGDKVIAQRLGIGFTTVRTHLSHAFRKLGVDNRVQLVACLARDRGAR
jgi:DNA-binding CsgD family transcriptional regulator